MFPCASAPATRPALAVGMLAAVVQLLVVGLYTSTVFRGLLKFKFKLLKLTALYPPIAEMFPCAPSAAARKARAEGIGAAVLQLLVAGLYTSTVLRIAGALFVPPQHPPIA